MGLATVSVRTYLVEISDTEIRGIAGMTASLMLNFGGIINTSLGTVLPWYHLAFFVIGTLAFFCLVVVPLVPESPTYLALSQKEREARNVLLSLRGKYVDLDQELNLLKAQNTEIQDDLRQWGALLNPAVLKNMAIVTGIFFIVNFCGTEVIRANATRMLQVSFSLCFLLNSPVCCRSISI